MKFLEEWDKSLTYRQRRGFFRKPYFECVTHMMACGISVPKSEYGVIARVAIAESGITGKERAGSIIDLWSQTIPKNQKKLFTNCSKKIRKPAHINENRMIKFLRSNNTDVLLENIRVGLKLIEMNTGVIPTVSSIYHLFKKIEAGKQQEIAERFYTDWSEC